MRNAANLVRGAGGWAIQVVSVLLSRVFQANAGSVPRVVGSLYRIGWGLACPRLGRSFSLVSLCLAEIEPFHCPSDSSNAVIGSVK